MYRMILAMLLLGFPFVRTGTPRPVAQAFSPSMIVAWIV